MKKYGLIGYPLGHSFSKDFFNRKFASEQTDAEYVNFELENIGELENILPENPSLCGLNVTIPYKTQVIPLLHEIDDEARRIGAVNVIKFMRGRSGKPKLKGFNTDVTGFGKSIRPLLNDTHRKALILGTGGASKAVFHALTQMGVAPVYVSRKTCEEPDCITYDRITPQTIEQFTLIVNTTPLGMFPHTDRCPDIPYDLLTPGHILYDLIYNPDETLFMKKGRARGATVKNGLEMLVLQAYESWTIWNT
ncbi:MAG: shikimate dehydrogenase [Tannerella sp.]|jgi:shikimate dehydrogenase|nr:shikimate dehydrogenase [Tannerella sp.]